LVYLPDTDETEHIEFPEELVFPCKKKEKNLSETSAVFSLGFQFCAFASSHM
jgi:hypothetical protein